MLLGTLFLQAANLVRVISLLYLRIHGSTWVFDLMHEDVWQLVFIGLAMACFLCWLRRATPTAASAA
jgi:exosortase/archaeosortase family protein